MIIEVPVTDKTAFYLDPEQGNKIRDVITSQIDTSFSYYLQNKVMMHRTNISSILSGRRVTTIDNLRKLLSGTRIELVACTMSFTLENTTGGIVPTAPSPTLEETLYCQDGIGSDQDEELPEHWTEPHLPNTTEQPTQQEPYTSPHPSPENSSELEKPLGRLKTLLENRSREQVEDTSGSSSTE